MALRISFKNDDVRRDRRRQADRGQKDVETFRETAQAACRPCECPSPMRCRRAEVLRADLHPKIVFCRDGGRKNKSEGKNEGEKEGNAKRSSASSTRHLKGKTNVQESSVYRTVHLPVGRITAVNLAPPASLFAASILPPGARRCHAPNGEPQRRSAAARSSCGENGSDPGSDRPRECRSPLSATSDPDIAAFVPTVLTASEPPSGHRIACI